MIMYNAISTTIPVVVGEAIARRVHPQERQVPPALSERFPPVLSDSESFR